MPGTGGEAYASYVQAIKSLYDSAWITPEGVTDKTASVKVEVVIARAGRVISDRIIDRSGIGPMDRSVQMALDRVRVRGVPAFPPNSKDEKRTFIIDFNLQTRDLL